MNDIPYKNYYQVPLDKEEIEFIYELLRFESYTDPSFYSDKQWELINHLENKFEKFKKAKEL